MDKHVIINFFHILAVAPFFIYVGITRTVLAPQIFTTLIVLGAILVLYHGYKFYDRITKGSTYAWVNAIHAFLLGPLLLYIGMKGTETPRPAFEILLLFAFAALGYHLYELAAYRDFHTQI
jgi:hypothetical protein